MGFYVQQMVTSSLVMTRECHINQVGPEFKGKIPPSFVSWRSPESIPLTMYIPAKYNHKAMDAILVYPLGTSAKKRSPRSSKTAQAPTTKGSCDGDLNHHFRETFRFRELGSSRGGSCGWTCQFRGYDVEARFLWMGRHLREAR
jgi:hypothetical protein